MQFGDSVSFSLLVAGVQREKLFFVSGERATKIQE